jgi:hypothetical protein
MGHRDVKRVPLDFDWPIGKVWDGYLSPGLPGCTTCEGDGYGPEARAVADTFYAHMIGGQRSDQLAWHDKLGQAEVDNLIKKGRLRVWRDGAWVSEPRTAAEVNAAQHDRSGFNGHDAINRWILVAFRCKRLGIPVECPTCSGHGTIGTEAERRAEDEWERTEPPAGPGWQLWETTTEGSPSSPVFAAAEELAEWCALHATWFGSMRWTATEWLASFQAGTTSVDSLLVVSVPVGEGL